MTKYFKILIRISLLLFMLNPVLGWAEENTDRDPFFNTGMSHAGGPAMGSVKETVDPFSGYLSLVHTDIYLPGKSGLDLKIMRFYNSHLWDRRDIYPSLVAYNDRSPVGLGWKMHMGELVNPGGDSNKSGYFASNPVLEMPDGSVQVFYRHPDYSSNNQRYVSKDYWTMVRTDYGNDAKWEVTASDGTKYIYQYDFARVNPANSSFLGYNKWWGGIRVAQCTEIISANGLSNITIEYEWDTSVDYSYLKTITDSVGREVTFNYVSTLDRQKLTDISVSKDSQTFLHHSYEYFTSDYGLYKFYLLGNVVLPDNRKWTYEYNSASNEYDLTKIIYPYGGYVSYTYKDQEFYTGGGSAGDVNFRVVGTRVTGGRGITSSESWTYSYSSPHSGYNVTTITGLNNTTEKYTYYGWGNNSNGYVWRVGRPYAIEIIESGIVKQREEYSWAPSGYISEDDTKNPHWYGGQGTVEDTRIYVPYLSSKTVVRDGKNYVTTYSGYDSYGNPGTIAEKEGSVTRRTTSTSYWKNTSKNMVHGRPLDVTVSGFGSSATSHHEYFGYGTVSEPAGRTGDLKYITQYGVTTQYAYYPAPPWSDASIAGQLKTVKDARLNTTTYEWDKGRISKITSPEITIQKTINADGTVESERTLNLNYGRNNTVTYSYGNDLRLEYIDRQSANTDTDIIYYDEYYNGAYYFARKREFRNQVPYSNGFWTDTYYDGLGRVVKTKNKAGLESNVVYKANGRKYYESSNTGSTTYFDILGRVDYIVDRKGNVTNYTYSSDNNYSIVTIDRPTIQIESSNQTVLYYYTFGIPDEKLLMKVRDASGNETFYNYNILGKLTSITQGGVTRTFTYNSYNNFLYSETHPEKGTITYGRDAIGNLTSRSDQPGVTYVYDGVNRLESINGMDISFTYDGDTGRATMNSPGADVEYFYDGNNRLDYKVTSIDGIPYTTNYNYDGNDNLTGIVYPSGMNIAYQYATGKNLITAILKDGDSLVSNIKYCGDSGVYCTHTQNLGQLRQFTYANGITTTLDYNERNMMNDISSGSALNHHYAYDNRGNTTDITVDVVQHFEYDSLDRLTNFNGSWGIGSYTYYPNGNRLTKKIGTNTEVYNYISNRLDSISNGNSYGYSNSGDLTSFTSGGVDYTLDFDEIHRLKSYSNNTGILGQYTYDGDGNRVTKTTGGKTITYHYDESGNMLSESNQNGLFEADYVYLYGKLVAMILNLPDAPSNLKVQVQSFTETHLTWSDNSNNETGFRVERSSSGGGPFSTITTLDPGATEYTDTALTAHSLYYYRIIAFNDRGDSQPSNEVHVRTEGYIVTSTKAPDATITPFVNISAGTISPFGNISVFYGNDLTFEVLPGFEHHIKDVVIDGTSQGPYDTYLFNYTHTFNNITSDHTIHAEFEINSYKLETGFSGIGFGSMSSVPAGIFCGTDCEEMYEYGTIVKLSAEADDNYIFTSWLGSGCTGTGDCIITVDQDKTVKAKFDCTTRAVRILREPVESSIYYDSLQEAYYVANNGDVIESHAVDFLNDLNLEIDKTVTFQGGYSCDYSGIIGDTRLSFGDMLINIGNVTVSNFTIGAPDDYHTLTVTKKSFDGFVTSVPDGLNCGTDCAEMYEHGTKVILTANNGSNSTFIGWSGGGCSGTSSCEIILEENANVVANYDCNPLPIRVVDGVSGAVRGDFATFQEAYDAALDGDIIKSQEVYISEILDINSDKNVSFEGGYNCDFSTVTGVTEVGGHINVTSGNVTIGNVDIIQPKYLLTINKTGGGGGTFHYYPIGEQYDENSYMYEAPTPVTVIVEADADSWFIDWSDPECGSNIYCHVDVDSFKEITAKFTLQQKAIRIEKNGTGSGTVWGTTETAGYLVCGTECYFGFEIGTEIILTADPDADSQFDGWGGDGCSGTGSCTIILDVDKNITATFNLK